ncbi:hypothetical protein KSP39_PZI019519 [Platanthera zijinensis]|uniref:Uncharacterized protein n=1 Tax=Platanthera zijinensis TaxID=2320716 RepID=A0AAP0B1P5_9ASPA
MRYSFLPLAFFIASDVNFLLVLFIYASYVPILFLLLCLLLITGHDRAADLLLNWIRMLHHCVLFTLGCISVGTPTSHSYLASDLVSEPDLTGESLHLHGGQRNKLWWPKSSAEAKYRAIDNR